jgi:hypothetical protein
VKQNDRQRELERSCDLTSVAGGGVPLFEKENLKLKKWLTKFKNGNYFPKVKKFSSFVIYIAKSLWHLQSECLKLKNKEENDKPSSSFCSYCCQRKI